MIKIILINVCTNTLYSGACEEHCAGFIDETLISCARPSRGQKDAYIGHDVCTCLFFFRTTHILNYFILDFGEDMHSRGLVVTFPLHYEQRCRIFDYNRRM
jgi:hypothetical protein